MSALLPRSARLVAWGNAVLVRAASVDDLLDAVQSADEPHEVMGATGGLLDLLASWPRHTPPAPLLRLALPRPGDSAGVVGPSPLATAALDVGEAAVLADAVPGGPAGWVPQVTAFGPPGDQGYLVAWQPLPGQTDRPRTAPPVLAQADRDLRGAVVQAADILAAMDVAAWRTDVAQVLSDLRSARGEAPLPSCYSDRAQDVAARAIRVQLLVDVASGDDGAAVTAYSAGARRAALAPLDTAARHALIAACDSVHEPVR